MTATGQGGFHAGNCKSRQEKPQSWQSTATASARQISRMRKPLRRPNRSVRNPTDTHSTESRFTAERRGIGSSPGSTTTSLASSLILVVQGATSARRSRGIAESRESTTTGRRDTPGSSHHQTSPLAGSSVTTPLRLRETTLGRPIRPLRRLDARHTPHTSHRFRMRGDGPRGLRGPHREGPRR